MTLPIDPDAWEPIRPPNDKEASYTSHATRQLELLARAWTSRRLELQRANPAALREFIEQVVRSWAIETGVLERTYEISEGATQTLIEQGLSADLVTRGDSDIDPDELILILRDHVAAAQLVGDLVSEEKPLSVHFIRELHQLLTRRQEWVDAQTPDGKSIRVPMMHGVFKAMPNNRVRPDGKTQSYAPPEQVELEVVRLLEGYVQIADGPPAHAAAWFHHRFTQIHPFQDGNGRVARALTNAAFIKADLFPLLVHRGRRLDYLKALELADRGDLTVLIDLFAEIESETAVQALSLSEDPAETPATVEGVVDRMVTRVAERLRDRVSAFRSVNELAVQLRNDGVAYIGGLAERAATRLEPTGLSLRVFSEPGGSDRGTEHWWKNAVIEAAKTGGYWVNFREGQYWFQVVLRNAPIDFHFVVSFHHVGHQANGLMRAIAFAEFDVSPAVSELGRSSERQERVRRTCSVQPFIITWQSTHDEVGRNFLGWLEDAYAVALRNWLDLF